jgi:hypothetical protein
MMNGKQIGLNDRLAAAGFRAIDREKDSRLPRDESRPAVRKFSFFDLAELLDARFEIEFLVNGILVKGQPGILAAPQKSLKTTLALDLAISLSAGEKFLGRFGVPAPRRVAVMSAESGLGTIQETVRRICEAKNLDPAEVRENLLICDEVPALGMLDSLNGLDYAIAERGLEVLILDPVYMMLDGAEAGNLFAMGRQLKPLADVCRAHGCTPILVHHTRKGSEATRNFEPLGLEDISWSGFAEFARQWFLLNRRERYEEGSGEHRIWFSYGGSAGQSGLWAVYVSEGTRSAAEGRDYIVEVQEAREAREAREIERETKQRRAQEAKKSSTLGAHIERVLGAFRMAQKPLTQSRIRELAGLNGANTSEALRILVERGEIKRSEERVQGILRDVFYIPDNTGQKHGTTPLSGEEGVPDKNGEPHRGLPCLSDTPTLES